MIELVITKTELQGTQPCSRCGIERDAKFFRRHRMKLSKVCTMCSPAKKYKRATPPLTWIINTVIESMNGCSFCDEKTKCCLCFHHTNPETKVSNISRLISQKDIDKLIDELNKCILVCFNCHQKIHNDIISCGSVKNLSVNRLTFGLAGV